MIIPASIIITLKLLVTLITFALCMQALYRTLERKTRVAFDLTVYFFIAATTAMFGIAYDIAPTRVISTIPIASMLLLTIPLIDFAMMVFHSKRFASHQNTFISLYSIFCIFFIIYNIYIYIQFGNQTAIPIILIISLCMYLSVFINGLILYRKAKLHREPAIDRLLSIAVGSIATILGLFLLMIDSIIQIGRYTELTVFGYSIVLLGYLLFHKGILVENGSLPAFLKITIATVFIYFVGYFSALFVYPNTLLASEGISYLGQTTLNSCGCPNPASIIFITTMIGLVIGFELYSIFAWKTNRSLSILFGLVGIFTIFVALPINLYPALHNFGSLAVYILLWIIEAYWAKNTKPIEKITIPITILMGVFLVMYLVQLPWVIAIGGILQQLFLAAFFLLFVLAEFHRTRGVTVE